jgi:hypothetical protein
VAAVAKMIVDNFQEPIDKESVIFACIFHDMGNIIKSDFNKFPEFLEPEGLEYWQKVKDEYVAKYGTSEHVASELIAKEINLLSSAFECLQHIGFNNATINEIGDSFENKICNYSDMRVDPYGVVAMEERMQEGRKRYENKYHSISSNNFEPLAQSMREMEKQIFSKTTIKPEEITDEKIMGIIEELRKLTV